MFLNKINKVAKSSGYLPTKKMTDLECGKKYQVTGVRKLSTKYGNKIVVDLDMDFSAFLPNRMVKAFEAGEEFLQILAASKEGHLFITYIGGDHQAFEFLYE